MSLHISLKRLLLTSARALALAFWLALLRGLPTWLIPCCSLQSLRMLSTILPISPPLRMTSTLLLLAVSMLRPPSGLAQQCNLSALLLAWDTWPWLRRRFAPILLRGARTLRPSCGVMEIGRLLSIFIMALSMLRVSVKRRIPGLACRFTRSMILTPGLGLTRSQHAARSLRQRVRWRICAAS